MSALSRLWRLRRRRPGFVALVALVVAFFALYPFLDWYFRSLKVAGVPRFDRVTPFTFNDFGAFTTAIERWQDGDPGTAIYWRRGGGFHGSYLYPPVYLLVFLPFYEAQGVSALSGIPFADSGFEAGAMTWGLFSVGLLWVGLQFVAEECGLDLATYERVGLLWLLFGFQPLLFSFKWGQTAGFQAGLLCFAYVGLSRGRREGGRLARLASGASTTLASGMKPFYATAGAHLLRDRDRLLGAVAGAGGLLLLSVAAFGPDTNLLYYEVLTWGKGWASDPIPPWLWGPTYYKPFYALASRSNDLAIAVRVVGVLAVVALSVLGRSGAAHRETFALGVASVPLFAPTAYTYDLVALVPAAAVLVAVEFDRDGLPWLPVIAVWLLGVQAYGLKLMVHHLPAWVPARTAVVQLSPLLQPGLWGNLALFGLAAYGVAARAPRVPFGTTTGVHSGTSAPE